MNFKILMGILMVLIFCAPAMAGEKGKGKGDLRIHGGVLDIDHERAASSAAGLWISNSCGARGASGQGMGGGASIGGMDPICKLQIAHLQCMQQARLDDNVDCGPIATAVTQEAMSSTNPVARIVRWLMSPVWAMLP